MLTLLIDMDGVVADLGKKWLYVYNLEYDDNLTMDQITEWKIETHAARCSQDEFHSIITRPGFFADLEVLPHSIDVLKRLYDLGHIIYFVTATPYDNPTGGYDKYMWLKKHFPFIERTRIIQAHDKFMIKGDVLFDDGPPNLKFFPGYKIVMDYPYNQNIDIDYRAKNWLEFETHINSIMEKNNK